MEFLKELNESRLYKRLGQINHMSVHDIAERLFEHLLALQILAYSDKSFASRYAGQIMRQQQFDGFRTSQPDLFNLITILLNQDKYSYLIDTEQGIGLPEMRLRRNLRSISNGDILNTDYNQLMFMIQQRFENLPGVLKSLRRQISDWPRTNKSEQKNIIKRLMYQMRESGIQSDLFFPLQKLERSL